MFEAVDSPHLVPFEGSLRVTDLRCKPPKGAPDKKKRKEKLQKRVEELSELQRVLYAFDRHALLLIFQAMDAAGKDSTIRAVMSGISPAGCQVTSFKRPSAEELDHDFLWRSSGRLPERGRIGIFNRSYYEEVLVVRVHPEILETQNLPDPIDPQSLWEQRFDSIRDHELHLARNGTVIVKFWLNVSREEQRRRFLERIDVQAKNWKFAPADVEERQHWDAYMQAYEEALNATSKPWAPWYAIPADDKSFMRYAVADIVVDTLRSLGLCYPELGEAGIEELDAMRRRLESEP